MPRQERLQSATGIYHVMLRGINKQDIFEDDEWIMRIVPKFHCADFCQSVTFASNVFKVSLLVKVMVLRKVSLSITVPKQVVLV